MDEAPTTRRAPSASSSTRVTSRLKVARTLWAALCVSNALYVVVLLAGVRGGTHVDPAVGVTLAASAAACAVASLVLPRRLLDTALRELMVTLTEEPGEMIGSFRESAPMRKVIAEPEQAFVDAFARYQTSFLLGMALAEAVGLFGLCAGYLGALPLAWAPYFVVSFALMATKLPRVATLARALERKTGAAFEMR